MFRQPPKRCEPLGRLRLSKPTQLAQALSTAKPAQQSRTVRYKSITTENLAPASAACAYGTLVGENAGTDRMPRMPSLCRQLIGLLACLALAASPGWAQTPAGAG